MTLLFKNLGLSDEILRAIGDQGYTTPTQVQEQAIPAILEGFDLMVGSQTGYRQNSWIYSTVITKTV